MMPPRFVGLHHRCVMPPQNVHPALFPLGGIRFSAESPGQPSADRTPRLTVPMAVLGTADAAGPFVAERTAWCETLLSRRPARFGQSGDVRYAATDDLLFAVLTLGDDPIRPISLQQATERVYLTVFALLAELGYSQVWRYWNYMGGINESQDGLERYRQFNLGRQAAFDAAGRRSDEHATAACALGFGLTADAPSTIQVALLAGKTRAVPIENPRQVRAIDYPALYGPKSPIFSRATLARLGDDVILFISGTASIVGHRSAHVGDIAAQVRETLTNIDAVVAEANREILPLGLAAVGRTDLNFRVYVRHESDVSQVYDEMRLWAGGPLDALFLRADICRQDLLVEIEASPLVLTQAKRA